MNRKNRLAIFLMVCAVLLAALLPGGAQAQTPTPLIWQPQIAIVWPHDPTGRGVPVGQSTLVNVSVWPQGAVACDARPNLQLLVARNNEPTVPFGGTYLPFLRQSAAGTFPSLEFNDLLANLRDQPRDQFRLVMYGEVIPTRLDWAGNVWVHAADARTFLPQPVVPTGFSNTLSPDGGFDVRIQVVWPKDQLGNPQPVERADFVNVAVEIFEHNTLRAAIPDPQGAYPFSLTLLMAEGNGALVLQP